MTIIDGSGWRIRLGLYWTWPHVVDRQSSRIRSYYFGPVVFEATYEWLVEHKIK